MKLININSKRGVVNLFADYILKKLENNLNSIIQVTDMNYFFVVNGITESTTVLNLQNIKDEFISEYQSLIQNVGYSLNMNIMDLIQYDKKVSPNSDRELYHRYFDSHRPLYNPQVLRENLNDYISIDYNEKPIFEINRSEMKNLVSFVHTEIQVSSSFPHGYSLSMNRSLLYYGEYIVNHLFDLSLTKQMDFYLTNKRDENNEPIFDIIFQSPYSVLKVKSLILDYFDFNFEEFEKKLSTYDLCDDIKKPTTGKPWLVTDKIDFDFFIF
jgi:hypothetical protein